jgi:glycosyltransferase involved in cell wall biosynthesis
MQSLIPTISIVVPIYNGEEYLSECIDSLLYQDVPLEIILVPDESIDSSGTITETYGDRDKRIKVIHQENRDLSAAMNTGLKHSSGKYVVFIDSNDYIEKGSLKRMLCQAENNEADMVMGKMTVFYHDSKAFDPFFRIIKEHEGKCFKGKDWFVTLFSSGIYYLMVCNYIFHRDWFIRESLSFDSIFHEDELWLPIMLSKAKRIVITNYPFYYYRQRVGSVMHSVQSTNRLKSLLYIMDELAKYSTSYTFREDKSFKSWLWTDIFRLYFIASSLITKIRDSSFILPGYYLYALPKIYHKLDENAQLTVKKFHILAKQNFKTYLYWRNHPSMKRMYDPQKQYLVLLYNTPVWITIPYDSIPEQFFVMTDRKYLHKADIIIFHMPDLYEYLDGDIDKPDNQIWIAWFGKEDERLSSFQDEELSELFDIYVSGYTNVDVQYTKKENEKKITPESIASLCKLLIGNKQIRKKKENETSLVSVVMPVYNVESYVEESVCSILSQTYADFEFIIINDGSTDNTSKIIERIQDDRIIFIDSHENKGNYNRRNEGCRLAKGKYICVMDGDDIAMPCRIEKQVNLMEKDYSIQACGSFFEMTGGYRSICTNPMDYSTIRLSLLKNNAFLHPSLMIRKEALKSVGYYNEKYYYSSDYDLVCKMALQGKIVNIPDILMKYRMHEKQISSAHYAKQAEFANQIRLDYLGKCRFKLSTKEKKLFTLMMTNEDNIRKQGINETNILSVINKLKQQNNKSGYFAPDIFNLFLNTIIISLKFPTLHATLFQPFFSLKS